jgi:hypothetical protein
MGEIRDVYKILAGKCDRKRPLERPTCKWGDNTEIVITEI